MNGEGGLARIDGGGNTALDQLNCEAMPSAVKEFAKSSALCVRRQK
jgi:hypothetical protein